MQRYTVFGFIVDSELVLHEELSDAPGPAEIVIRWGTVPKSYPVTTLHEQCAVVPDVGRIQVRGGREVTVDLEPGASMQNLSVLLSGRIMAFLLRQRGWLPLHASAVEVGGRAALFLAASGTGKSTMAAHFHLRGYRVLSDDVSPVMNVGGVCLLRPGLARVRLLADTADACEGLEPAVGFRVDKHDYHLGHPILHRYFPVARIYLLQTGPEIAIEPVPAMLATATIAKQCFMRLTRANTEAAAAHLKACSALVAEGRVRALTRPRDLKQLDAVLQAVVTDLGSAEA